MDAREIARMIARESAQAERVAMVARVTRKRSDRQRTLARRQARAVKYAAQGR